jgi:hypothetical protein
MLRNPHYLDNRLTDGGKVVSPTHQPRSTPQKNFSAWGRVRSEGLRIFKKSFTSSYLEHSTFRLVAQCLNHCATVCTNWMQLQFENHNFGHEQRKKSIHNEEIWHYQSCVLKDFRLKGKRVGFTSRIMQEVHRLSCRKKETAHLKATGYQPLLICLFREKKHIHRNSPHTGCWSPKNL